MPKVKVCGITNADDALLACDLGADALGFIFYEKSPRHIAAHNAKAIVQSLPPFVTSVGVFVNATPEFVNEVCADLSLDLAQLHGDETPQYCAALQSDFLKVFRVGQNFDLSTLAQYPTAKGYLLDTYQKDVYGGTGHTFDWSAAAGANQYGSVVLSGGLSAENVRAGITAVAPYAVDVCSGVEAHPGKKDPKELKRFMQEIEAMKPPELQVA